MKFIFISIKNCVSFLYIFSLLLVNCIGINAQQPNTILIDDLVGNTCEYQRAQIDNLLTMLKDAPEHVGLIIIHGEHSDPIIAYKQKATITDHLRFRKVDSNKIVFQLGESESKFRTELWKVLANDSHRSSPWDYKIEDLKSAVLVHSKSWTDGIGCWYVFNLQFYSEFLTANDNLIGRVIIRDKSVREYSKIKTRIADELIKKYKIPKNKIEFGFIQSEWSDIEYWYVPSDLFSRTQ